MSQNTTDLSVSTYVCVLETNIQIDKTRLSEIFNELDVIPYENTKETGIVKVGVLNESKGLCKKMISRKTPKNTENKKNNTFRNQIGSYIRIIDEREVQLTKNQTKLNKIKKSSYYNGERLNVEDENLFIFKKGQTAFQYNSITLFWDKKDKLNTRDDIRIITSVARKSQESNLKNITLQLTQEDIDRGFYKIDFDKGYYANAIMIYSKFKQFLKMKVEFVLEVNMFLFTSGKIKVSGCTSDKHIDQALKLLIEQFKKNITIPHKHLENTFGIDLNEFKIIKRTPIMFNSDFAVNIEIKRFELDNLIRKKYNILSSFEPNTHPAVKIKFYSNECYSFTDGQCHCMDFGNKLRCRGKGNGDKIGECKIVTILVFQSGEIILTGSRGIKQSQQGCQFITNIISENINDIKK